MIRATEYARQLEFYADNVMMLEIAAILRKQDAENHIMRATLWGIATSDPISSVNLIEKAQGALRQINELG